MKATELRIGNILDYNGNEVVVLGIGRESAEFDYLTDSIGFERKYDSEDFPRPIPLTPEILEKCGFEVTSENSAGRIYHIVKLGEFLNDDMMLTFWKRGQRAGMIFRKSMQIQYFHQLQNLVFALIGEELNVSQIGEEQVKSKHNLEGCDCECPENGMVSNCCPVHNYNPYPKSILDE